MTDDRLRAIVAWMVDHAGECRDAAELARRAATEMDAHEMAEDDDGPLWDMAIRSFGLREV
jgi:hypothetical protein